MVPIYRTDGEWVAVYVDGHLFNLAGDWLGFLVGRSLFDPLGEYVGFLSDDRRLLRKRILHERPARRKPPATPPRPRIPSTAPLPPLMRSLPFQIIDLFEEHPERFKYISDTRPDLD